MPGFSEPEITTGNTWRRLFSTNLCGYRQIEEVPTDGQIKREPGEMARTVRAGSGPRCF